MYEIYILTFNKSACTCSFIGSEKKPRFIGAFKILNTFSKNYLASANALSAGRPASNTPVTALIADSSSWPAGIGGFSL